MPKKIKGALALTGGGAGALDAIDGNDVDDGDMALVYVQGDAIYHYILNATSGADESSPDIIAPDVNPGTKRWVLHKIHNPFDQALNTASLVEFAKVNGLELDSLSVGFSVVGGTTGRTLTVDQDFTVSSLAGMVAAATFDGGTAMVFCQAAAPTGWTKSVAHNNKALRVVSGSGGGSGGNVAFTTAFQSSRGVSVANHVLTIAQIPPHTHPHHRRVSSSWPDPGYHATANRQKFEWRDTGSTGGGKAHGHTGSTVNLDVRYVDAIICIKD